MKRVLTTLLCSALFVAVALGQGVTTSAISGKVSDVTGESLVGATIIAVHTATGSTYGTTTDLSGNYRIANMRVGTYNIKVSYTGFGAKQLENVYLRLGEAQRLNFELEETAAELETIVVSAVQGTSGQNSGASTQITSENIDVMPTLNRNIDDYVRLTPQVNLYGGGGISVAGTNNRYNAIYIDGAVNNDVFGLASQGTNGGQTGIAPFSIDIIDQFQVVLSPYDVTLGGFAGGGINAVTKSGTNEIQGTAYYYLRNAGMIGKTNTTITDRFGTERSEVPEFSENLYGFSLGGPIVKDKVFFFVNAEIRQDETPNPYNIAQYTDGASGEAELNNLRNVLINQYGYDPGTFGQDVTDELNGTSLFGKVDFNLSDNHKLTLRHQYTKAENIGRNVGDNNDIQFSNNGVFFPSTTNSTAIELNSTFGTKASNNLIIGYTTVRDERDPIEKDFPYVTIFDGNGRIRLGSEQFSTANQLDQDIFTITDNFKIYSGDHTYTIGTHNEFYSIYNLFIPQNYGSYEFASLADFVNGANATEYFRSYSLVDNITGDGSAAAADFNAAQFGFYVQDEWAISDRFTMTGGIRLDIPVITTDPQHDPTLATETLPLLARQYQIAGDVVPNSAPDGQLMWSPRLGFNYDVNGDNSVVVRGGLGIFTSRIPFVWPGAMYNNNGLTQGAVFLEDVPFKGDINDQYTNPNFSVPSGDLNLFVEDFKYPQVFRSNLGLDFKLPGDIQTTLEGIYTNTINNVNYANINSSLEGVQSFTGTPDTRNRYTRSSIDPTYRAIYVGYNTGLGYTYTLTTQFAKNFDWDRDRLSLMLAYTYGDAFAVSEGTSSQNSSQWRGQVSIDGRNSPVYGRSDFAGGHRLIGSASYTHFWSEDKINATTISLFMDGHSGIPYSYVVGGSGARNFNNETGSTSRNRSLVYIPVSQDDIVLVDVTDSEGNVTFSAEDQWSELNAFIEDDPYLSKNRGSYAGKNSNFAPWETILDLAVRQDFGVQVGDNSHRIQISFDVFNFLNLINSDWGVRYQIPGSFSYYELLNFQGFESGTLTPTYTYNRGAEVKSSFNFNDFSSRWRARLGFRYIFN